MPGPTATDLIPPGFKLWHTLRGHNGVIQRIAWSPDGKTLASPSKDRTIRLWDLETGELCRTLTGHTSIVRAVVWSPDGSMIASGSHDYTIRLWDVETGKLRQIFELGGLARSVAWSPDGKMLASSVNESVTNAIRGVINWEMLPRVSSNELFQRIKAFLVEEKEAGRLLSTADDLYHTFLKTKDTPAASDELRAQFETCVGRVESRGLIQRLSFGPLVLLQPELLDAYASALVNAAKEEPDGLGCIREEHTIQGRFRIPEDERIKDKGQEKLLLIATVEDLLNHEIALREPADDGPYLYSLRNSRVSAPICLTRQARR